MVTLPTIMDTPTTECKRKTEPYLTHYIYNNYVYCSVSSFTSMYAESCWLIAHILTEHAQTEHMHHYHLTHDFDVLAEAKELELFTLEGILLCDLLTS